MMKNKTYLHLLLSLAVLQAPLHAISLITEGSFESTAIDVGTGLAIGGAPNGTGSPWATSEAAGDWVVVGNSNQASAGTNSVYFQPWGPESLLQRTGATFDSSLDYTLTFDYMYAPGTTQGFGMQSALFTSSTIGGTYTQAGGITAPITFSAGAVGTWTPVSVTVPGSFYAGLGVSDGEFMELRFTSAWVAGGDGEIYLDNISFADSSVVPEPSTYALLTGLAVLAFACLRNRRKQTVHA